MADARDFPPEADPPEAEKSTEQPFGCMSVGELKPTIGVYVLLGSDGAYLYKGVPEICASAFRIICRVVWRTRRTGDR